MLGKSSIRRRAFTLMELIIVLVILFILGGILFSSCSLIGGIKRDYSTGSRTGTIIKFSKKGTIWDSYEGTLQISSFGIQNNNVGSTVNSNVWDFSLPVEANEQLIKDIDTAQQTQSPVTLKYNEWWHKPYNLSTSYEVTDVVTVDQAKSAAHARDVIEKR